MESDFITQMNLKSLKKYINSINDKNIKEDFLEKFHNLATNKEYYKLGMDIFTYINDN